MAREPEYGRLRSEGWTPSNLMHALGGIRGALVYAPLFVPEFIEIEGCVFLKDLGVSPAGSNLERYSRQVREARATSAAALQAFLSSCNWVEIVYLFSDRGCSGEEEAALADAIVKSWSARLSDCFPARSFQVRLINPEESGTVLSVGFEEAAG